MSTIQEIVDWLRNQAEDCMKNATSRRSGADATRNATVEDLRSAKAMAEKMFGRKLPLATTDIKSNRAYVEMQDRIADKLELEARQLSEWADFLHSITPLPSSLGEGPNALSNEGEISKLKSEFKKRGAGHGN